MKFGTFGTGSVLSLWDIWYRFRFVPGKEKHKKMDLNITKLANLEGSKAKEFLGRVNSKLMMDVKKNQIVENEEWLDMVEFTIPYIEKALIKQIKQIVTEEEIIKIELIKKVTVESVKHLSKKC